MDEYQARELDYGMAMSVQTLVEALGMHWENEANKQKGIPIRYTQQHFNEKILEHGVHHNGVLGRWQGK